MAECEIVDGNFEVLSSCLQQAAFFNDPMLLFVFILIAFLFMLTIGRQNLAIGGMFIFGLSSAFYMMNPVPLWSTIAAITLMGSMALFVRGVVSHVQ